MYATLYDFIVDLFGPIPALSFLKVVNSFGLFVALGFIISSWIFALELKRKEKDGLVHPHTKKTIVGKKPDMISIGMNGLIGFLFGFKLIGVMIFMNSNNSGNPQDYLLSSQGNVLAGIVVAALMAYSKYKEQKKEELPSPVEKEETIHPYQLMGNMTILAAITGIIGAKIFHHLENFEAFMNNPSSILDPFAGLTFYGGLICGGAAVIWYAKKHKIKIIHLLDASGPVMISAYGIGRIGCHVSGDGDWGIPNEALKPDWLAWAPDWLWAYGYPNSVLNQSDGVFDMVAYMTRNAPDYVITKGLVFPTAFYETLMMTVVFIFLWNIRKRLTIPGAMFSIYLIFNGLERFLIEKIRVNEHLFGTTTQAEVISSIFILAGVIGLVYSVKQHKKSIA